jgi:hypothetical protein
MSPYDAWKCSGADYPGDDYPEYDSNEQEDDDMQDPDKSHMQDAATQHMMMDDLQSAVCVIKRANARELRLLTATVNGRREQLERELKAELSELGNVDKAPRSPNKAPRSDKGKPRAKAMPDEVQP